MNIQEIYNKIDECANERQNAEDVRKSFESIYDQCHDTLSQLTLVRSMTAERITDQVARLYGVTSSSSLKCTSSMQDRLLDALRGDLFNQTTNRSEEAEAKTRRALQNAEDGIRKSDEVSMNLEVLRDRFKILRNQFEEAYFSYRYKKMEEIAEQEEAGNDVTISIKSKYAFDWSGGDARFADLCNQLNQLASQRKNLELRANVRALL